MAILLMLLALLLTQSRNGLLSLALGVVAGLLWRRARFRLLVVLVVLLLVSPLRPLQNAVAVDGALRHDLLAQDGNRQLHLGNWGEAHAGAALALALDNAFVRQRPQRAVHRGARAGVFLCEGGLPRDRFAEAPLARHDARADRLADAMVGAGVHSAERSRFMVPAKRRRMASSVR